jgi:FAD/FMN-containing dehydrogenase
VAQPRISKSALETLRARFSGSLVQSGDPDYNQARRIQNGLSDKRPVLIVRCRNESDIAASIGFAREHGLELAVRGGGHNVAGRATVDDGMMIDLSPMKAISVDAGAERAVAEGGVTWGEFNGETQRHGLATTGGAVSTTGIAGLTLGGGWGYLMGKHGLAADNLSSATVVTADSQIVRASDSENSDLYWALRGGGGNFGVVSSFEYRLHAVGPTIMAGMIAWPFSQAREVLRFYRDVTESAPDELGSFGGLAHAPDGSGVKIAMIVFAYCGSLADGEEVLRPIKRFGSPIFDTIQPMSYSALNSMFDPAYPKGMFYYWKSSFLESLSDEAIQAIVEIFGRCPSKFSGIGVEHWHGAAARVPQDQTSFPHRHPGINFMILSQWQDPAVNRENFDWGQESFAATQRFFAKARYVNYLDQDDAGDLAGPFGANYARLAQIKAKYDPGNLFHLNQNIRPAIEPT